MGLSFLSRGCIDRDKERWNQSHTNDGSACAEKDERKTRRV
jgi:hypothetical protein